LPKLGLFSLLYVTVEVTSVWNIYRSNDPGEKQTQLCNVKIAGFCNK